jgi:hypothetical protein
MKPEILSYSTEEFNLDLKENSQNLHYTDKLETVFGETIATDETY